MEGSAGQTFSLIAALVHKAEEEIAFWRATAERRGQREQQLLARIRELEGNAKKRAREGEDNNNEDLQQTPPTPLDPRDRERFAKLTKDHEEALDACYARQTPQRPMTKTTI